MQVQASSGAGIVPRWRVLLRWGVFSTLVLFSCEFGARLDDLVFEKVPLSGNPSYESLFKESQSGFLVGREFARWKKVRMNNLGFRGRDLASPREKGCGRWLFLGASETFGEPSVADGEYPSLVGKAAARVGCTEVINSAFPGIAPQRLASYYTTLLARYHADLVFIYPSTHFYLAEELPRRMENADSAKAQGSVPSSEDDSVRVAPSFGLQRLLSSSRFLERLRDSAEIPPFIQRYRVKRWIEGASQGKPDGWHFSALPEERLDLLEQDLKELVEVIRSSGAEPILMTHAVRVTSPPRKDDSDDLLSMRVYVPRASGEILASFEYAAAERTRLVAAESGVRLVDVAKSLSGHRELFIDLVHFSSKGHEEVARLIAEELERQAP